MTNLVLSIAYFLIAIALLIAIHEYGHFIVARLLGVKVLRFSLGFGKTLLKWQGKRGTEYVIAVFPLGGYVKMLDEAEAPVPVDQLAQAFNRKPLWIRTSIVIAGPLFNMLFAIFALWLMFVIGINSLAPIVGQVNTGSIAAYAQLEPSDEMIAINRHPVASWRDVQLQLMPLLGGKDPITIDVHNLKTDKKRSVSLDMTHWKLDTQRPDLLDSLGIQPELPSIPAVIEKVLPKYPAQQAGLQPGDKILAVNGVLTPDWNIVVDSIQKRPNQLTTLKIERGANILTLKITPNEVIRGGKHYGVIGAQSVSVTWPKNWLRTQRYSMLAAIKPAFNETWMLTKTTCIMLGKFVSGKLSIRNISGPIGIAQGAGQSAQVGFSYYLSFLALVSISLGILNILPIPMLDGGHLLYYAVEMVTRKPLSENARMIGTRIGLAILMSLMLLALFNDLTRLASSS